MGIVCGGAEDITSAYSVTEKSTCVLIDGLETLQINEPLHIPPPIWLRDGRPSGSATALVASKAKCMSVEEAQQLHVRYMHRGYKKLAAALGVTSPPDMPKC